MNTILTDDELPPLQPQDHPEPHSFAWTEQEMRAIRARDRLVEAAVLAKMREQEPVLHRIRVHLANRNFYSHAEFCDKLEELIAAPLPAVVQVPQERRTAFGMTHVEHLNEAIKWLDSRRERLHHEGCSVHEPSARCNCGLHKALTNIRAVVNELAAAPEAPAQPHCEHMRPMDKVCAPCRRYPNREAQAIPAPWREAVKVAREALEAVEEYMGAWPAAAAALAQLDALEGGE